MIGQYSVCLRSEKHTHNINELFGNIVLYNLSYRQENFTIEKI